MVQGPIIDHRSIVGAIIGVPLKSSLKEHELEVPVVMTTRLMPTKPHQKHKARGLHRCRNTYELHPLIVPTIVIVCYSRTWVVV